MWGEPLQPYFLVYDLNRFVGCFSLMYCGRYLGNFVIMLWLSALHSQDVGAFASSQGCSQVHPAPNREGTDSTDDDTSSSTLSFLSLSSLSLADFILFFRSVGHILQNSDKEFFARV